MDFSRSISRILTAFHHEDNSFEWREEKQINRPERQSNMNLSFRVIASLPETDNSQYIQRESTSMCLEGRNFAYRHINIIVSLEDVSGAGHAYNEAESHNDILHIYHHLHRFHASSVDHGRTANPYENDRRSPLRLIIPKMKTYDIPLGTEEWNGKTDRIIPFPGYSNKSALRNRNLYFSFSESRSLTLI
ncbi:hypothetical protein TNIN_390281 [Trichonephila inaurata madagascariensis]|uniref:Uncharacterized protein n=1 Tax=Trichonephila inaurata madagascariensis TaxID=2747483 RepID=A0A8X6XT17_9ARAC|nr:hypothetical protein TNIN_390281 [Trichonephila inaurata madagascariensis]